MQSLAPGKYTYKYVVDGNWVHSPDSPTESDGAGGLNNVLVIEDSTLAQPPAAKAEGGAPTPKAAAPAAKAVAGKKAAKKKEAAKKIGAAMTEDILPLLEAKLKAEEGVEELELGFDNNQLQGFFRKGGVPYTFWAYFPDGELDGARGFSLSSYNNAPSAVEPFLIDERKVTPDLLVFWVHKRLFAQKVLSLN
eukprot:jgi/Mesen1/509/ME000104S10603